MSLDEYVTEFAGLPVVSFEPGMDLPTDPNAVAWRVAGDWDTSTEEFTGLVEQLLETVEPADIRALIVGEWGLESFDDMAPIGLLAGLAPRLTGLRALFVGEMTREDRVLAGIRHGDITPLLAGYPRLEVLRLRGGDELKLTPTRLPVLRELTLEACGLPGVAVRAVGDCDFLALEHLELWIGHDDWGGDVALADLTSILGGSRLPALRHLGLRNSVIADEVAAALASAPVVTRLEALDLSLGNLSDAGAAALLAGQSLTHLRRLDLRHHYLSEAMSARLTTALAGVEVDLSDRAEADGDRRYVAVLE